MNHNHIITFFLASSLAACNPSENKQDEAPVTDTRTTVTTHHCYEGIYNRDTIFLELHRNGDSASGQLQYSIFEKDRNNGTFRGLVKGDTLLAYYTFLSEGKESVRQVAFLQKDSSLYEGYGNVQEEHGRMVFKEGTVLNFPADRPLKKVACRP